MLKATVDKVLPTTITGSLPRPSWYTENLGTRSFLDAMVTSRYREQYVDALSVYLRDQELAGLDAQEAVDKARAKALSMHQTNENGLEERCTGFRLREVKLIAEAAL